MTKEEVKSLIAEKIRPNAEGAITAEILAEVLDSVSSIETLNTTTYAELKALRDSGDLVPGASYRITDYQCTTTQENTRSAGHVFDIIVVADSASVLNENARAIPHDGDTYFTKANLSAWRLKYSLDNDTAKYAWADEANGKGVIYWMKDEWSNECPYDFKNIQFYVSGYDGANKTKCYCYTFTTDSTGEAHDGTTWDTMHPGDFPSIMAPNRNTGYYNNVINPYYEFNEMGTATLKQALNFIVFASDLSSSMGEYRGSYNNVFTNSCHHITLKRVNYNNVIINSNNITIPYGAENSCIINSTTDMTEWALSQFWFGNAKKW